MIIEPNRVLAERAGCRLVLADGAQRPTVGRPDQSFEPDIDGRQDSQHQCQIEQAIKKIVADRGFKRARKAAQPLGAAGQPFGVARDGLQGDRDAERGDGEIVVPQPERQRAEEPGDQPSEQDAARDRDRKGQQEPAKLAELGASAQQHRHIGAGAEEGGDAAVEQASVAPLQVQPEHDDGQDGRHGGEEDQVGDHADHA
jgi:hypothetical protein